MREGILLFEEVPPTPSLPHISQMGKIKIFCSKSSAANTLKKVNRLLLWLCTDECKWQRSKFENEWR